MMIMLQNKKFYFLAFGGGTQWAGSGEDKSNIFFSLLPAQLPLTALRPGFPALLGQYG